MEKGDPKQIRTGEAFVVAVSGISGAGKSSVVDRVAALLNNAVLLRFDDYAIIKHNVADIRSWLECGANPDEFKTPRLPVDLRKLMAGEIVHSPGDGRVIEPADLILVEEPFGRSRSEIGPLITFAVHLDVPADVALARRFIRAIESQQHAEAEALVAYFYNELRIYIAGCRDLYGAAESAARRAADIVLDGLRPVEEIAAEIVAEIHKRRH